MSFWSPPLPQEGPHVINGQMLLLGMRRGFGGDEKERDSRGTLLACVCVLCVSVKLTGKPLIELLCSYLFVSYNFLYKSSSHCV